MISQKYQFDENKNIEGVEDEEFIVSQTTTYDGKDITVLVTIGNDEYYNIYLIDDYLKKEPLNNLKEQIPKSEVINISLQSYFNSELLEKYAIEHYLWLKYKTTYNLEEVKE